MIQPTDLPEPDLTVRLLDTPQVLAMDTPMRRWFDQCLRQWGGVSLEDATWADLRRASQTVAAVVVERSPDAAAVMAGHVDFTAADVLTAMRERRQS